MQIRKNVMCPMRDGVGLATDLYMPDTEGRYPVILMRTPYNKNGIVREPLYLLYPQFVEAGFVVAIQDCRGTGSSDGKMNLNGGNDQDDGYDAVEWLAVQDFCDGKIGMYGLSYFGFTQMAAAGAAPKHLVAACPFMAMSQETFGASRMQTVNGGHIGWAYGQLIEQAEHYMPDEAFRNKMLPILQENRKKLNELGNTLPMTENPAALLPGVPLLDDYLDLVRGVEDKEYWDSIHAPIDFSKMHVAMFFGTGWLDMACNPTILNFVTARSQKDDVTREEAKLLIGPWTHGGFLPDEVEGVKYTQETPQENQQLVSDMMLRWFKHHLKGEDTTCFDERVRYYITGENKWASAEDWPPAQSKPQSFYLTADNGLTEAPAAAAKKEMVYDPANPAPASIRDSEGHFMMADWSMLSSREDVLQFQTETLTEKMTIAGAVELKLTASTDVPDTDFACRLTDIAPDGRQIQLTNGIVRARHRKGMFHTDFLEPGQVETYTIPMGYAAHSFLPGHKIGIQLMGSMYPTHNRNLNTKEAPTLGKTWAVAHDQIHLGGEDGSCLILPVMK